MLFNNKLLYHVQKKIGREYLITQEDTNKN